MDMVPIYIFGNDDDKTLGQMLQSALSPFGTAVYPADARQTGTQPCFCITEQKDCSNLPPIRGIAVFKKSFVPAKPVELPPGWVAVISACHDKLKEALRKTGQITVTCGTKATDTFSISGINENQASVSLLQLTPGP